MGVPLLTEHRLTRYWVWQGSSGGIRMLLFFTSGLLTHLVGGFRPGKRGMEAAITNG